MKITMGMIPHIEKALGIELYKGQVIYLIEDGKHRISGGRRVGKTLAHCIHLALSEGEPLEIRTPEKFSDYGDGSINYAKSHYKREFLRIREQLKGYGFPVRDIIHKDRTEER